MTAHAVDAGLTTLVTKIDVKAESKSITGWLARSIMVSSKFAGFISGEIVPPETDGAEWTLVQRFAKEEHLSNWKKSNEHLAMLKEMSARNDLTVNQEDCAQYGSRGTVTTAIVTDVHPGQESAYRVWEEKVQEAQAKFAGFQGSYLQTPTGGTKGMWVTLLRFDKPESLDLWLKSPQRQELLTELDTLVKSVEIKKVTGSFPGWVPTDPKTGKGPANWKTACLVLFGLYPVVILQIVYMFPSMSFMHPAISNFLGLIMGVALTTWVNMPNLIRLFNKWLFPQQEETALDHAKWVALMCVLFAVEIVACWPLFKH